MVYNQCLFFMEYARDLKKINLIFDVWVTNYEILQQKQLYNLYSIKSVK